MTIYIGSKVAAGAIGVEPVKVIPIGDSITFASGCVGLWEYIELLSGGRISVIRNAGTNSNTTTLMAGRFAADVVAYKPDVVAIMGSVNNGAIPISQLLIDYTSMINAARAADITPIIVSMPTYNAVPSRTAGFNAALWNLAISKKCAYIDPWANSINPANGNWESGAALDGTHPTQPALLAAANKVMGMLTLPSYQPMLQKYNSDTVSKISNGMFLTNTVAGTPDGWTIPAGLTSSLTAGVDPVRGNWFNVAFSGLTATLSASTPINVTGFVGGDVVLIAGRVKGTGLAANGNGPLPSQPLVNATLVVTFTSPNFPEDVYVVKSLGTDIEGAFSKAVTFPGGATAMTLNIRIGTFGGAVSGTYSIAQLGCYKI